MAGTGGKRSGAGRPRAPTVVVKVRFTRDEISRLMVLAPQLGFADVADMMRGRLGLLPIDEETAPKRDW